MKTNNIIYNRQVLLLSIALLISSCVTFKPDFYDSETKTYNNYKSNYSVKILDDFEFTLKDKQKAQQVIAEFVGCKGGLQQAVSYFYCIL